MAIFFVYRSHYAGPFGKRVVTLPDASILDWFCRGWSQPDRWVEKELGGHVYGLETIFNAAREHQLPPPQSWQKLRELLKKHLYVEGEIIFKDAHALRVLTDDDEVSLAYFFFDEEAAKAQDRVAWALEGDWPLPAATATPKPFQPPVKLRPLGPPGRGAGCTYAVLLTFYDSDSFDSDGPWVFQGVRLPELTEHLRNIQGPEIRERRGTWIKSWPLELRLLRAMVEAQDTTLGPALARCNAYRGLTPLGASSHSHLGLEAIAKGRQEFEAAAGTVNDGDPSKSLLEVGTHHAVLARHSSNFFGFQSWFLFDDDWAGCWPDLAASLLRWGDSWDIWKP